MVWYDGGVVRGWGFSVESFAKCVRLHGSTPQSPAVPAPFSREPECKKPPLKGEGDRRQAVEGFRGHSTTRPIIPLIQTTSYLHKRTDRLSSLCVLIVEPNIFKLFLDTHSAIGYTKFKAIQRKE